MPSRRTSSLRGNAFQDEIEKFFYQQYAGEVVVHNQKPVGRMIFRDGRRFFVSARNDIFGAFDLVVLLPGRRAKFIQATLHTAIGEKKKVIDKLPWDHRYSSYEVWQKIPRKGVRILVKIFSLEEPWLDLGTLSLKEFDGMNTYFQIK